MNLSRNLEDSYTFLELPKQGGHAEKAINYVAVIYKTMSDILSSDFHRNDNENEEKASPKKIEYVNSAVLSLTTQADFGELDPPLNLTFKHVNQIESKRMQVICVSWDFAISKWTERGCKMKQSDHSTTKCQCKHLTNFAILMRPYSANVKDKQSLKTMSLGGVIISILFTVMTLIIYVRIWRFIKSDQNIIMLHLCSSLILSYIIFLSAVEWTENENMCIAITAIIHYLFLVTFFSMLGMGVYYFMSITVTYYAMYVANNFKSKSRVRWFLLVIWGFPAVITVTNVGAFWGKDYHLRFYCWLSMESGSLYMFIIPVCLIVVLNIAIIVTLVRVLCASSAISKSSLQKKATSGLRSLGTLIPVLGVTWLFGILAVNEHVDVFQYIFVIANSCQGLFIFISHVVLNKKVMQALRHEYPAFSAFKSITEESKKETTTVATSQLTSNLGSKSFKVKRKGIIERIRALKRGKNKVKDSEVIVLDETLSTDCSTSLSHEKSFKVSENEPTINTLELESARENTGRRFQFSFNLNPWKKKYTITEM